MYNLRWNLEFCLAFKICRKLLQSLLWLIRSKNFDIWIALTFFFYFTSDFDWVSGRFHCLLWACISKSCYFYVAVPFKSVLEGVSVGVLNPRIFMNRLLKIESVMSFYVLSTLAGFIYLNYMLWTGQCATPYHLPLAWIWHGSFWLVYVTVASNFDSWILKP